MSMADALQFLQGATLGSWPPNIGAPPGLAMPKADVNKALTSPNASDCLRQQQRHQQQQQQ
jgi:hypothetical protein